jgi:uncharacterized membrane protein YccC
MKPPDSGPAIFALKTYAAAMLAYYVALRIGLLRPFWAVTTVYIVSQPLAGAVLSKSVFRLIGTVLGAAAAIVLVPNLVNEPAVLSAALALWLGFCMFVALLDHTPRAYIFLLAGYTASIVGFPSVNVPGTMFNTGILRVQELFIGILSAALIHGMIFPSTVTRQLIRRVGDILSSAEAWTCRALEGDRSSAFRRERRRLILDISDLQQLSYHLPFDTERLVPRIEVILALQEQLSLIVLVARTIEDRIDDLSEDPAGLPGEWRPLLRGISDWLRASGEADFVQKADMLIEQIRVCEPHADRVWTWRDMLVVNLAVWLKELINAHRNARHLAHVIGQGRPDAPDKRVSDLLSNASGRSWHSDAGLALRIALGAAATVLLACLCWIATEWADGAVAALIAGVTCALFGGLERPAVAAKRFLLGSIAGCGLAMIYGYAILPRVTDFVVLAAVLAPTLLLLGSALARPALALFSLGAMIGMLNTVGLNATYSSDFVGFINSAIAQNVGTAFAIVTLSVFRTIGADEAVQRLRRAGFRDVVERAEGRYPDMQRWTSRMLDRIGMLISRSMTQASEANDPVLEAFQDLRIGFVAGELHALEKRTTSEQSLAIQDALAGVSSYYARRSQSDDARPHAELLAKLDRIASTFANDPDLERRRAGVVLVTGLRCNLFPGVDYSKEVAS